MTGISVIIPVKNRLELLLQTLQNIFNQTLQPDEIIVVDDHSEDNTFNYLTTYFKERLIVVRNKKTGPGAARNTGIEIASGNYIQFFDSDDLMTLNKLEQQTKMLIHSDAGFVYSPFVKAQVQSNGNWQQTDVVMFYKPVPKQWSFFNYVARGICPITQCAMFKKELIKETGKWREDIFTHEDLDFWFRVSEIENKPIHTNRCAVIYRQHGRQLTDIQTRNTIYTNNQIKALQKFENKIDLHCDWFTKILFKARLYASTKFLAENQKPSSGYENYLTEANSLRYFIYRLHNKKERMLTRSNWERMHGVTKLKTVFTGYISALAN